MHNGLAVAHSFRDEEIATSASPRVSLSSIGTHHRSRRVPASQQSRFYLAGSAT